MIKNRSLIVVLTLLLLVNSISLKNNTVSAAWSPKNNEIAPTKDTYISIDSYDDDELSNFGLASTLYIGEAFDGTCLSAIQFNLSALPENISSLDFKSDVVVYGSSTRNLKVFILKDIDWDEMNVTGIDNPFNALDCYTTDYSQANLTSITLGSSTTNISFSLMDHYKDSTLITLVFSFTPTDSSWITMSSKENQYLSSYSNPPHLVYTVPTSNNSPSTPSENPSLISGFNVSIMVLCAIGTTVIYFKNKSKKQ